MHYHLILTELCNSKCRYCYGKSLREFKNKLSKKFKFDFSAPPVLSISVTKLRNFLKKDKNPVLIFYGGEPLLEIDKIKEIIDNINIPFRMQTNGKLLHKLPIRYLKKIEKILVSIDGSREITDFNRGLGTYDTVIHNISLIKSKGYSGEIIARMTVSSCFPHIYEQVISLANLGFTSIHWQLDAGFYQFDFNKSEFQKFVRTYNPSISKLVNFWISKIKKGYVLRLYPFIAIVDSLLKNEKVKLRCGAGHSGYAITTDGKIVACPIMNHMEEFVAGNIEMNPNELKKFEIGGGCLKCSIKDLCGGRCLYWNKTKLWPREGNILICATIHHLITELKKKLGIIKSLIRKGTIPLETFSYEKYFGPEIIP